MKELVFAVERGYVAAAKPAREAAAAIGAVASRFLAVGTPRSIGLIGPGSELSLEAHRTWFDPKDIRTDLEAALAADIVCVHDAIKIPARAIRRGTHINVLCAGVDISELEGIADITHETPGLAKLAAGLIDGRQLDEITIFVIGDAKIAIGAIANA